MRGVVSQKQRIEAIKVVHLKTEFDKVQGKLTTQQKNIYKQNI